MLNGTVGFESKLLFMNETNLIWTTSAESTKIQSRCRFFMNG